MQTAASRHATVFAVQESAFAALLLAATHPEQVERLILFGASPSWAWSEDLPDEWTEERWEAQHRVWEHLTSHTDFAEGYVRIAAPSLLNDDAATMALRSLFLNTQGMGAAIAESRMLARTDLRPILASIATPTLVLRRADDEVVAASSGRYLAEHLPYGEYQEVPGQDALPWIGDQRPILDAIESFMGVERRPPTSDRRLATVLFTDIVDSSGHAAALGDVGWSAVLAEHHRTVRRQLGLHGGTEVDTAGDGFFVTFEGPAQAVRCARAIAEAIVPLGIEVRAGVHTGEVETIAGKPGGVAVHVGARVAGIAGPSQVFVSRTVRDLVTGSGLAFEDAGEHELKGVPGSWRLYRVVDG